MSLYSFNTKILLDFGFRFYFFLHFQIEKFHITVTIFGYIGDIHGVHGSGSDLCIHLVSI